MKYLLFGLSCFISFSLYSQSNEERAIEKQLKLFEQAHNNRDIDSMMLVVSSNYEETFLPDIRYDALSLKNYYSSLIGNEVYRPVIDYQIKDIEVSKERGISDVVWEYIIFPSQGTDTLYYALNKGVIHWEKEGEHWKMKKAFGGNLNEINNLNGYTADKVIQNELLDWIDYYNKKDINKVMSLYHPDVKGLSTFNGSYIFFNDLMKEYENIFNSSRLLVKYQLDGVEEIKFSNDLAYSITVWRYNVYDSKTDISNISKYRHLSVWERQPDSNWKIISFVRKKINE